MARTSHGLTTQQEGSSSLLQSPLLELELEQLANAFASAVASHSSCHPLAAAARQQRSTSCLCKSPAAGAAMGGWAGEGYRGSRGCFDSLLIGHFHRGNIGTYHSH